MQSILRALGRSGSATSCRTIAALQPTQTFASYESATDLASELHGMRRFSITLADAREDQNPERPTTPWVRTGAETKRTRC